MARRSSVLRVLLNGREVAVLCRASNGAISFGYLADWLRWDHAQPVSLSLPLTTRRYTGDAVIAVFDNLFPDNADIRRRVAGRVGVEGDDPYSLLAAVGRDCVGALQFLPDSAPVTPAGTIETEALDYAGGAFWCVTE